MERQRLTRERIARRLESNIQAGSARLLPPKPESGQPITTATHSGQPIIRKFERMNTTNSFADSGYVSMSDGSIPMSRSSSFFQDSSQASQKSALVTKDGCT